MHFTVDNDFQFIGIVEFYGVYINLVAVVMNICNFCTAHIFLYSYFTVAVTFQCYIQSHICVSIDFAAFFVEVRIVQRQCVLHLCVRACCVVSCCVCQLYFRPCHFVFVSLFDLVLCVVLGTHNLSCSFYVAGSRKCSCGNQGYDHSRSHHHGKKFLHGSFLLLSRLFISFSFHNYTTNLLLVCTASLPSATGKNGTSCTAVHSPIPQRASDSLVQSSSVPKRYRESTDFVCKFIILMHSIFGKRKFRM